MKPVIEAKSLDVGYGNKTILKDLSFEIFPGDFICLMGSNGRGKTTLLRTLSGIITKLSGDIRINKRNLESLSEVEIAKQISVVLTDRVDVPNMTVRELVALGRYPHTNFWGRVGGADERAIDEALEAFNFLEFKNTQFGELSDGQKQKVLIARALAQDTPVLFLDEPTTFLDIPRKMELMSVLREVAREKNKAILFSSHDWDLVLEMNSLVWLVDDFGKLHTGMPEEIILEGKMGASFDENRFKFSQLKGRFVDTIEKVGSVSLRGDSEELLKWTAHALHKMGIEISSNSEYTVDCQQGAWCLQFGDSEQKFDSLFALVWAVYKVF